MENDKLARLDEIIKRLHRLGMVGWSNRKGPGTAAFMYGCWYDRAMSHTPGPWRNTQPNGIGSHSIMGPDGLSIASIMYTMKRPVAEKAANACLITAAPDLLRECKDALSRLSVHDHPNKNRLDDLKAAIAKAEGKKEVAV